MIFRPFPVLSVLAVPILATLVWLGTWQLQRAEWKQGLIETYEAQVAEAPQDVSVALCGLADSALGATVVTGDSVRTLPLASDATPVRMFGADSGGQAGWALLEVVTPPACEGEQPLAMVVETGFEALQAGPLPPAARTGALPDRYIVVAWPPKPGFAAANAPDTNDWHWFDAPAIAAALAVPAINDRYYLKAFSGELPDRLVRTPPATHYGYAVTWYGMALAFIVIYGAFHARAGRLRFRHDRNGSTR